ncbi:hypothetical protein U3516DRAFT_921121 [Neocallimastix sp. 'constans']|jgi:hypothetical protein
MISKSTCLFTPPLSPNVYLAYKQKQPVHLRIRTTGISNNQKRISCSGSRVYPSMTQMSVAENQKSYQKLKENTDKFHEDIEKIMENTHLICSFLKTICIDFPVDHHSNNNHLNKDGSKKNKVVSLEKFVATILLRTKLTSSFVYVALLFIHRYMNNRIRIQKTRNTCPMLIKDHINSKMIHQKKVYHLKNVENKLNQQTKRRHSISKSDNKVKVNQRTLNSLLQQQQQQPHSNKRIKLNENIVCHVGLPEETYIKSQKDLIFAAMILSSKYLDDNSYCNSAWVKLTDKTLKEVFELEREFLMTLDYKFYISNEEWDEWYSWINHFKILLEAGMSSSPIENNKSSSPSGMISVPSQTNQYYYENTYLLTPVDTTTPKSSIFPNTSKMSLPCSGEVTREEMRPMSYQNVSGNVFFPSLYSVASFIDYRDYCPSVNVMAQNYQDYSPQPKKNVAGQQPYYLHPSRNQKDLFLYNDMPSSLSLYEMEMASEGVSFVPKDYYIQDQILERKAEEYNNYSCQAIDNSIISQAQSTTIDFSEVQRLTQKHNVVFKEPILPINKYYV